MQMLTRVKKYSETRLDKIIIATGDTNQSRNHWTIVKYNKCLSIFWPLYWYNISKKPISYNLQAITNIWGQTYFNNNFKLDIINADIPIKATSSKYFKMVKQLMLHWEMKYARMFSNVVRKMNIWLLTM